MAVSLAVEKVVPLRTLSDISTKELSNFALQAGKDARERALDAGLEVRCTDNQGRKVVDKKMPDGTIKTVIQDESGNNDKQA